MIPKIAIVIASVLVLLVVLPLAALQFPVVQDAVLARSLALINQTVPGSIRIAQIGGNFPSSLKLIGVEVRYGGEEVASAQEVELEWNPAALLTKSVLVQALTVRHARVSLAKAADGRLRLAAAFSEKATEPEKGQGASAWVVQVKKLHLEDALATQPTAGITKKFWLGEGIAKGGFENQKIHTEIAALSGAISSPPFEITSCAGEAVIDLSEEAPQIWVNNLAIASGKSRVWVDGTVNLAPSGGVRIRLAGNPLTAELLTSLGAPVKLPLRLELMTVGTWSALQFNAELASVGGGLSLAGTASLPFTAPVAPAFDQARVFASGELKALEPNAWFGDAVPGNTRINAALAVTAEAQFEGQPRLQVNLDGARSRLGGHSVREFSARLTYEKQVAVAKLRLDSNRGLVNLRGHFDTRRKTYQGRAFLQRVHPEDFLGSRWKGEVTGSISLAGQGTTLDSAAATARIQMSPSQLAGYRIEKVVLPVTLKKGRIDIVDGRVESDPLDARIAGNLPVRSSRIGTLRLLARTEDIGALLPAQQAGEKPEGRAMLHAVMRGSLENMRADVTVRAQTVHAGSLSLPDVDASIEVRNANLLTRTGSVELLANAGLPDLGGIGFDSMTVAISVLQEKKHQKGTFLVSAETRGEENRVRGRYELTFPGVIVTLEDFALQVQDSRWQSAGEAVIDTRADGLTVRNFEMHSGEQNIAIDGLLDTSGRQQLRVHVNRVQLAPFAELLGTPGQFGGQLDGTAWAAGTLQKPRIESTFVLAGGTVRGYQVELATVVISYADGWLDGQMRLAQSQDTGALVADVRIPLALGSGDKAAAANEHRQLSGSIVSEDLSLQIASAFSPEVSELGGRVDLKLVLRGTLHEPRFRGTIGVSNGAFKIVPTGVRYTGLEVEAKVNDSYVNLTRIRVQSEGGGEFSAKGRVPIPIGQNSGLLSIEAVANNLRVMDNDLAEAAIDANLSASGTLALPQLSGTVHSKRVVINLPKGDKKQLAPLAFQHPGIFIVGQEGGTGGKSGEQQEEVRVPLLKRAMINVLLTVERNSWVRGGDANIELRGEVRAVKQAGEESVRLAGEIRTVRGYYQLQGKRLTVEEGVVNFTGTQAINPLLDITLSYDAAEYKIGVHVTGTTEKPNLGLTSQPPLETADIVAVLVFGKPFERLGSGEQTQMRERVGNLLGGFAATQLREQLGGRLGIDTLDIRPSGEANDEGAEIGVGKYVSEDVFVQYVQRFGSEAASEVRLEYYFTNRWLIQTSATTEGESGADVFWNLTF